MLQNEAFEFQMPWMCKKCKKWFFKNPSLTFLNSAGTLSPAQNRHCLPFTSNVSFRAQNNLNSIPWSSCIETWHISCRRYGRKYLQDFIIYKNDKILSGWLIQNIQEITGHDGHPINNYDLKDDLIGPGVQPQTVQFHDKSA